MRKIDEVREYSMKILEVILEDDENDDGEGEYDNKLILLKNQYKILKQELDFERKHNPIEEEYEESSFSISESDIKKQFSQFYEQSICKTTQTENKIDIEEELREVMKKNQKLKDQAIVTEK